MLDSLVPAVESFQKSFNGTKNIQESLKTAVSAAYAGMISTENLKSKFGRGSWRPDGTLGKRDGGATALYFMIESFARHLIDIIENKTT